MLEVDKALDQVKELYEKVLGRPAPQIEQSSYVSFPPGVDPLQHAVFEVQHLKELSEKIAMAPRPVSWIPRADCYASKDAFVVQMEIPGVERDDVHVFVAGGECLVRGERKAPELDADLHPLTAEQPRGSFERRFPLPGDSLPDKATARFELGVLEVRVPLEFRPQKKETEVKVS